jgi:hypothetical protein
MSTFHRQRLKERSRDVREILNSVDDECLDLQFQAFDILENFGPAPGKYFMCD